MYKKSAKGLDFSVNTSVAKWHYCDILNFFMHRYLDCIIVGFNLMPYYYL